MTAVLVVLLVLALALLALRRRARRRARGRGRAVPPSRMAPAPTDLVGRTAVVIERIANGEGVGCVAIDGQVWTARALEGERVIDAGEEVEVVEFRGATALVAR
ncbi:MAG TPA: NfeD family protein [Solirubrobacteraceae bacterium]|nr:NfeD family protein [Solirubrobacteraceae bacterium]